MNNLLKTMTVFTMMLLGCESTLALIPSEQHHESPRIVEPVLPLVSRGFNVITENELDPFPEVCAVLDENGLLRCTGTLIAPNIVLTAGHCVCRKYDIIEVNFGGVLYCVKEVIQHPSYKLAILDFPYGAWSIIESDASILILDEKVEGVEPISINSTSLMYYTGSSVVMVGYGGGVKKYSPMELFWYYGTLESQPSSMKILTLHGSSVYYGDSGGPVYMVVEGDFKLVGIILSFSADKGQIYENSACRVDIIYDWIERIIKNEGMVSE